jgi:hypothetical protein
VGEAGDALPHRDRIHLRRRDFVADRGDHLQLGCRVIHQHQRGARRAEHLGRRAHGERAHVVLRGVAAARLRPQLAEHALQALDALLERLPAAGDAEGLERAAHREQQLLLVQRLREVVEGAEPQRLEHVLFLRAGGQDHDPQVREALLQLAEHLEPVQIGELEIEDHDADFGVRRELERVRAGRRRDVGEAGLAQHVADRFAEEALVVDDQHTVLAQALGPLAFTLTTGRRLACHGHDDMRSIGPPRTRHDSPRPGGALRARLARGCALS